MKLVTASISLIMLLLVLVGCESDFDKCFRTNQAKLIPAIDDIDFYDALLAEKPSLPKPDVERIIRTLETYAETTGYNAIAEKADETGCPAYDKAYPFSSIEYKEGTECHQIASDYVEKSYAMESKQNQLILEVMIRESGAETKKVASDLCNVQGLYD